MPEKPERARKAVTLAVNLDTAERLDHGERHEDLTDVLNLGSGSAGLHSIYVPLTYRRVPRVTLLLESWGDLTVLEGKPWDKRKEICS